MQFWIECSLKSLYDNELGKIKKIFSSSMKKISLEEYKQAKEFIFSDIKREIDLAKSGRDAGNFLCALALLCYTEFAGVIKYQEKKSNGDYWSSKNFNCFFDDLGEEYKIFRKNHDNLYNNLRCGLAHGYFPKEMSTIVMLKGSAPMGVLYKDSRYFFIVEKYFEDFKIAFEKLESEKNIFTIT